MAHTEQTSRIHFEPVRSRKEFPLSTIVFDGPAPFDILSRDEIIGKTIQVGDSFYSVVSMTYIKKSPVYPILTGETVTLLAQPLFSIDESKGRNTPIDYRDLLKKYITGIVQCEGIDYINECGLTDEERQELEKLAEEGLNEARAGPATHTASA